jgi:predicted lysophospholipase L1 biosynthesis ABC-type transport system permease subunit
VLTGNEVGIFMRDFARHSAHPSSADLNAIPGVRSVRWTHKVPPFGRVGWPIGIVDTDAAPITLEALRDQLVWSGAEIHSLPQLQERAKLLNDDYSSIRRAAMALTLFLLLVCGATLLVAMVDWLMERRRSLAVLSAIGVTTWTIRRSILLQVVLPLTTSLVFGVAGAIVITRMVYTAVEQPVVVASRQIVLLVGAVGVVVVAVTALSAPWLRITRRPELLREA